MGIEVISFGSGLSNLVQHCKFAVEPCLKCGRYIACRRDCTNRFTHLSVTGVHLKAADVGSRAVVDAIVIASPCLFFQIVDLAAVRNLTNRATYHVSAEVDEMPAMSITYLPNFRWSEPWARIPDYWIVRIRLITDENQQVI